MALSLRKGLSIEAEAALKEEICSRGIEYAVELSGPIRSGARVSVFEAKIRSIGPALFRLVSTAAIFFLIALFLQSQTPGGASIDVGKVIANSIELVFLGPGLPFDMFPDFAGVLISIAIWAALITTAIGSSNRSTRLWFHGFLTVYIILTLLGLAASFGSGLVAMAHTLKSGMLVFINQ